MARPRIRNAGAAMAGGDTEQPTPGQVQLRFGGGINTRELLQDLDDAECADGSSNFSLDIDSAAFFRRKPFDLVGTTPGGVPVQGFAQLLKNDGTLSTLIQAGSTVYLWDGTPNGFTMVGNCQPGARLRTKLEHNFSSQGLVLITDLALKQQVSTWDGTTFQVMTTGLSNPFFAKYCRVEQERAWFSNVQAGTPTPHMIVGSQVSNPFLLSISNEPSTALGTGDPFFMLTPDLGAINSFDEAFGQMVWSSVKGDLYQLIGTDSTDYGLKQLYQSLGASGDEAMAFIGNDLAYGRNGRIESLFAVLSFGNVESAELSRHIATSIQTVTSWTLVYDRRLYRLYALPVGGKDIWVFHRSMMDDAVRRLYRRGVVQATVSPWAKWNTNHPMGFQPVCFWTMQRPTDGLWMVYLSDGLGNIFQFDGQGGRDGGTSPLTATRTSKLILLPDGDLFDVKGWIDYQRWFPATVNLTVSCGGINLFDTQVPPINLEGSPSGAVFGGGSYFNNTGIGAQAYYGLQFPGRVSRQRLTAAGRTSHAQITVSVTGNTDFFINNITLDFNQAQA